ncbi:MAG: AmmeMemoRadiSam system protein A [Deltaproteobacteria bacterium]|nr:AmmeMemoRadiSam system protein A [Deltaproteobacteria bacterium]
MSDDRQLTAEERKRLLAVARGILEEVTHHSTPSPVPTDLPGLDFHRGAFVTLHRQGQLRGCIGNFTSDAALVENVRQMARAAATQDPRFSPVRAAEVPEIDLEISVLSPLTPIDDVNQIEVGKHGIYLVSPWGRGVLLPQVATEQGWDRDTFLDHTCLKAGLPQGCWRDEKVQILVFSAEVFGEKDMLG